MFHCYCRKQYKNTKNSWIIEQNLVLSLLFSLFTAACASCLVLTENYYSKFTTIVLLGSFPEIPCSKRYYQKISGYVTANILILKSTLPIFSSKSFSEATKGTQAKEPSYKKDTNRYTFSLASDTHVEKCYFFHVELKFLSFVNNFFKSN